MWTGLPIRDDRRVVLCQLTDEGEKAIGQFWRIGRDRLDIMVSFLDDAQLEKVVTGLELIHWAENEALKRYASKEALAQDSLSTD